MQPLSTLSASIEHPLGAGGNRVECGTRMELLETLPSGQVGGDQNGISGNVAKWAGGKQKFETRVRLG